MHSLLPIIMKYLWKDISKGIEVWADPGGIDVLKAAQSEWKGVYASVWECIVHCCS